MPTTEAQKRATNKYGKKCKTFTVKFNAQEADIADAFNDFLIDIGSTSNSYIKNMIISTLKNNGYLSE